MKKLIDFIRRACSLQGSLFKESGRNPEMASFAVAILIISSIAAGIGSVGRIGVSGILLGSTSALASWLIWASFTYFAAAKIAPGEEKEVSYLRFFIAAGFASAPGIVKVLAVIRSVNRIVFAISFLWMIAVMAVALKEIFKYKTAAEAILLSGAGWLAMYIFISFLLGGRVF